MLRRLAFLNLLHRRILEPPPPSQSLLPLEVWEQVLEELSDEELLIALRVCSAFNDRCVVIYLARSSISQTSLATGNLNIESTLLPVLQLSRLTPQINTLVCSFSPLRVLRNMTFLRDLIIRSHTIGELQLSFEYDLLNAHTIDTAFPYPQHALQNEFCNVLRAMVAKTAGPVVIITSGGIYRIHRCDVLHWEFRYFTHGSHSVREIGRMDRARFGLKPAGAKPHLSILVWRRGMRKRFHHLDSLYGVNVRSIPGGLDGTNAFTLITFISDKHQMWSLDLGAAWFWRGQLRGTQLTTILPHITLPSISSLDLHEDIDPTVFGEFLLRHPKISEISYRAKEPKEIKSGIKPPRWPRPRLLTSQPLALPSLTHLSSNYYNVNVTQMIPLLNSFGLSPHLYHIKMPFKRSSPAHIASLKRTLRCLSLQTGLLTIEVDGRFASDRRWMAVDDEERQIVGCLYSVDCVELDAYSGADLQLLLPWLAMLPALRRVVLWLSSVRDADTPVGVSTLSEVRAALPWVPQISYL
ncbi:hypothetical protein C8R44DRAFT_727217 [Mycena epipterygia]|nr:hypothetical protein C8R44DRAFT_727217 [Mycena epipterygia]